jgi:arylsulfatase
MEMTRSSRGEPGGRLATLWCFVSAASLFALVQALFIMLRQQGFDVSAAIGLAKGGTFIALVTAALVFGLVQVIRRFHPAARAGDRPRATRSLLFGLLAAVSAWMIVDAWVAGPLVPSALEPWIEIAAMLAIGVAVIRCPPSALFCWRTSWLIVLVFGVLMLPAPAPPGTAQEEARSNLAAPTLRLGGAPRSQGRPAQAPDVVLVSIDTFRTDRIGAYGSERSLTPEIDRFASEGFVFDRAVAASPWTVPSVVSLLTGLPTVRHGAGLPLSSGPTFTRSAMDGGAVTVAERFAAAGYRTRAVVANGFLSPAIGVARGFEEYFEPMTKAIAVVWVRDIPLARLVVALHPVERWGDYRAQGVTDRALEMLAEEDARPLFLWVHYIDLHTPYQADPSALDLEAWGAEMHQDIPSVREDGTVVGDFFAGTANVRSGMLWLGEADRERIEAYYDGEVAYLDHEVGRLLDAMRDPGRGRSMVAALTADHGEEFWDHGRFEHGHDYYREVTRVPLIVWSPGQVPAGRAGEEPVGLVDVPATLLDLAGLEAPTVGAPDEGESLIPFWEEAGASEPGGESAADAAPASPAGRIRFSEGNLYGMPSVLLEEGPWRFILRAHGAGELYHAFDDPLELENRVAEHPELVATYRSLLEPRLALLLQGGGGEAPELDARTKRALQSLGYVQ